MPVIKPKKASTGKKPKPARITRAVVTEVAKAFTKLVKKRREERQEAKGTLLPKLFKKIEKLSPEDLAALGAKFKKDGGGNFTSEDIRNFDEARKRAVQEYGAGTAGAPLYKLLAASTAIDKARASKLTNAVMYRIKFNELFFSVTAGKEWGCKDGGYHQVHFRLEEWAKYLTTTDKPLAAVKKAAEGRISFDCNCQRHQFWYRYLATIGGFALSPTETAFPKKRNAGLDGCCCKHTIKALLALRSPSIQRMLAKEMETQAREVGFGDDKKRARDLTDEELKQASRARKKDLTDEEIQAAAQKVVDKKASAEARKARTESRTKEQEKMEKLKAEKETLKVERDTFQAIAKNLKKRVDTMAEDKKKMAIGFLRDYSVMSKALKVPLESKIGDLAKNLDVPKEDLIQLAKEEGIV